MRIFGRCLLQYISLPLMQIQKTKPKLLSMEEMIKNSPTTNQQYLQKHLKTIQITVTTFLLGDIKGSLLVQLKRSVEFMLIRKKHIQLQQQLVKLFYHIYKQIILQLNTQNNSLLALLAYYTNKKQNYRILFDLLNNYLGSVSLDIQTVEQKAYNILCKQIINSSLYQKIVNEILDIITRFRSSKDHNEIIELEYQLRIIASLGLFSFCEAEVLERSKLYFVRMAQQANNTEQIFVTIHEAIKRQALLNRILKPSEDTVKYLQKEMIEEYFPFMIQFVDYLIHQNKFDKLAMLWQNTLRLGQEGRKLLQIRLTEIVRDISQYFEKDAQEMHKILEFINRFTYIVSNCFDSNKAISNLLYNTVQQILNDHQKLYNQVLSKKIFKPCNIYTQQVLYKLFKLLPNKQRFIKQFQIRFFRWVLNNQQINLSFQEQMLAMIRKQCGFGLCKKIDRMFNDVWRDNQMVYHSYPSKGFKCRLISANDWPKFNYANINMPQQLTEIIQDFEKQFKKEPQNRHKQLTWINQFGILKISINGLTSTFSQFQAAIIFILDKSFRPMKKSQLIEILQGNQSVISEVIDQLERSQILTINQMNETYELNNENEKPYKFITSEKQNVEEIKTLSKRDDTIIIQAYIVRIMKKRKAIPRTDLSKFIYQQITVFRPSIEQINQALERLVARQFIEVDKMRGSIRYKQ